MDTKANIPVRSNQDLVEMFEKHKASKCCYMTFYYHSPGTDPLEIPAWDVSSTSQSVEAPFTPSMPCPSIAESSLQNHTQSAETEQIPNPDPCSEFLCDGEGLYINIGPQNLDPVNPHSQQREPDEEDEVEENDSDGDDESSSEEEDEFEDIDEVIRDREPPQKPDANYDSSVPTLGGQAHV